MHCAAIGVRLRAKRVIGRRMLSLVRALARQVARWLWTDFAYV